MNMPHRRPIQTHLSGGNKVAAGLSYLLIALAVLAIALAIAAAAGGLTSWALTAAGAAVVLVAVGGGLWLRQAAQKRHMLVESNDRAENTEGKGPLGI